MVSCKEATLGQSFHQQRLQKAEREGEPDFRGWKGRSDGQTLGESSGSVRKDREQGRLCGRGLGARWTSSGWKVKDLEVGPDAAVGW